MNEQEQTQITIIELLSTVKREGMDKLIAYLKESDYFTAPASTRFHGCYRGGLAHHHLRVYELLTEFQRMLRPLDRPGKGVKPETIKPENLIIAALLHDVCKLGAYIGNDATSYRWNRSQPSGHALLSLSRIREYIELELLEIYMIQYHMGVYGLKEFEERKGEYNLRDKGLANVWFHNPIVKVMYFCDELSSMEEL